MEVGSSQLCSEEMLLSGVATCHYRYRYMDFLSIYLGILKTLKNISHMSNNPLSPMSVVPCFLPG